MTAREVLLKAAEHIERYGWRQGDLGDRDAPCCALGSISAVPTTYRIRSEAADELARYLLSKHGANTIEGSCSIARWSDAPGRTRGEVVAALRGAAGEVK